MQYQEEEKESEHEKDFEEILRELKMDEEKEYGEEEKDNPDQKEQDDRG